MWCHCSQMVIDEAYFAVIVEIIHKQIVFLGGKKLHVYDLHAKYFIKKQKQKQVGQRKTYNP